MAFASSSKEIGRGLATQHGKKAHNFIGKRGFYHVVAKARVVLKRFVGIDKFSLCAAIIAKQGFGVALPKRCSPSPYASNRRTALGLTTSAAIKPLLPFLWRNVTNTESGYGSPKSDSVALHADAFHLAKRAQYPRQINAKNFAHTACAFIAHKSFYNFPTGANRAGIGRYDKCNWTALQKACTVLMIYCGSARYSMVLDKNSVRFFGLCFCQKRIVTVCHQI